MADAAAKVDVDQLEVVDVDKFLANPGSPEAAAECAKAARSLRMYGLLVVHDSRATEAENDGFLDMLEKYFEQPDDVVAADVRKDLYYQVGTTPSFTELPRDHWYEVRAYKHADAPLSLCPPEKDPKMRFFWRIGSTPADSKFPQLNAAPVVPAAFPAWASTMDGWGGRLLGALNAVAEMAAVGLGLPADALSSRMLMAPNLLAPTASDLSRFGKEGTVLAGYHYDLNALTIHGRSRFPGLYVWARDGHKMPVKIPAGCLLVQAGKQLEYVTGGYIEAGFHEVVVDPQTTAAIERAKAAGRSTWRISSTLFGHFASDVMLEPLGRFGEDPAVRARFPPIYTGEQVAAELAAIKLASPDAVAAQ